jgi:dUTP pyrophosphatase
VAQLVLCRVYEARWEECDELNETGRGGGGFGHTGTK